MFFDNSMHSINCNLNSFDLLDAPPTPSNTDIRDGIIGKRIHYSITSAEDFQFSGIHAFECDDKGEEILHKEITCASARHKTTWTIGERDRFGQFILFYCKGSKCGKRVGCNASGRVILVCEWVHLTTHNKELSDLIFIKLRVHRGRQSQRENRIEGIQANKKKLMQQVYEYLQPTHKVCIPLYPTSPRNVNRMSISSLCNTEAQENLVPATKSLTAYNSPIPDQKPLPYQNIASSFITIMNNSNNHPPNNFTEISKLQHELDQRYTPLPHFPQLFAPHQQQPLFAPHQQQPLFVPQPLVQQPKNFYVPDYRLSPNPHSLVYRGPLLQGIDEVGEYEESVDVNEVNERSETEEIIPDFSDMKMIDRKRQRPDSFVQIPLPLKKQRTSNHD